MQLLALAPLAALAAVSLLAAPSAQTPATIVSTFDTSVEGWTQTAAVAFAQQPAGGNPGGRLFIDNSEGQICFVFAPAAFLGARTAYAGGTLSFDGMMVGIGGSPWSSPGQDYGNVRLTGGGRTVQRDLAPMPPSTTAWQTYSAPLDAASWSATPADFAAVLANLTEIRISMEALFGAEQQAIDNVKLAPARPTASCTPRNGSGTNPVDYACVTAPVLGAHWRTTIALLPDTAATVLALAPGGPLAGAPTPFGELLVNLAPPPLMLVAVGTYTLHVPNIAPLAGAPLASQGFRVSTGLVLQAMNAIDLVLGY